MILSILLYNPKTVSYSLKKILTTHNTKIYIINSKISYNDIIKLVIVSLRGIFNAS